MRVLILFALIATVTTPAYAYIDPGTGSFILQGIIGAFATGLFTLKIYWQKLKTYFSKEKQTEEMNSENSHEKN